MKIAFISNFLNHHQLPLLISLGNYFEEVIFISTEKVPNERILLGYHSDLNFDGLIDVDKYPEKKDLARKILNNFDVVIIGSAPFSWVKPRVESRKLTFKYSERLLKKPLYLFHPLFIPTIIKDHTMYRNYPYYLLSSGAFVKKDFSLFGAYPKKALRWGYFPDFIRHDIDVLMSAKRTDNVRIIWAGRFISYKRPLMILDLACFLREHKKDFMIEFIGSGPLYPEIVNEIKKRNLQSYVAISHSLPPEEVRKRMDKSSIFIMSSNREEGWGVVLNEAMNSGCSVITNKKVGSTGYLIRDGQNGLVFESKRDLFQKTLKLLNDPNYTETLGRNAYQTIMLNWNPEVGARNLFRFCNEDYQFLDNILEPCSRA